MNDTGPLATPWVVFTTSPRGRSREKAKPVPPPDWWMSAAHLSASKMRGEVVLDRQDEAGGELAVRRGRRS